MVSFNLFNFCLIVTFAALISCQEDVQRCVTFLKQLPGANCHCDSGPVCSCEVNGQRVSHEACRLASGLSGPKTVFEPLSDDQLGDGYNGPNIRRVSQRLQEPFPPANGIDLRPRNVLLGTLSGFEEPIFHLRTLPGDLNDLRTQFFLFMDPNSNSEGIELNYNDVQSVRQFVRFEFRKIYVIGHDFNEVNIGQSRLYNELKARLLGFTPGSAVIFVDWTRGARARVFGTAINRDAAVNAVVVGREVGLLCYMLSNEGVIDEKDIYLIGNGLGAQMFHFAATYYTRLWGDFSTENVPGKEGPRRRLGRFTALDPTAEDFQGFQDNNLAVPHVGRFDANFVDVIHTSCVLNNGDREDSLRGRYGMSIPCGTVDFYPNGCVQSQTCSDLFEKGRVFGGWSPNCYHAMALHFFIASITTNETVREHFIAFETLDWTFDTIAGTVRFVLRNRMGIDAEPLSRDEDGLFSLPIAMDSRDFSIVESETDKVRYSREDIKITVPRVLHANFREPNMTSGLQFDRFPFHDVTEVMRSEPFELFFSGQFRTPPQVTSGRVAQGQAVYEGQFPWVVCLLAYNERSRRWRQACTGSLLTKKWMLFAAHCFTVRKLDDLGRKYFAYHPQGVPFYITFGVTNCEKPSEGNYRRILVHPNYIIPSPDFPLTGQVFPWDIALVRLPIYNRIEIPDIYEGGPINSICWRAAKQFNYLSTAPLYMAGFGVKNIRRSDTGDLTWLATRTVRPDLNFPGGASYKREQDSWPGGWVSLQSYERNLLQLPCGGDSGAPYAWYATAEDDDFGPPPPNVSLFRGVQVALLAQGPDCDNPIVGEDGRIASPPLGVGIGMPEVYDWVVKTIQEVDQRPEVFVEEHPLARDWYVPSFI